MKYVLPILMFFVFSVGYAQPKRYFISPTGNDGVSAVQAQNIATPWRTLTKAWSVVVAGDTIYCRGGTYATSGDILLSNRNGNAGAQINIFGYQNEAPVFDWGGVAPGANAQVRCIHFESSSWVHVRHLRVTNLPQGTTQGRFNYGFSLFNNVDNCTIEFCEADHIGGSGFHAGPGSDNNTFLNCDADNNQDPFSPNGAYENTNGFEFAGLDCGTNNKCITCRAWWNCDDGFDAFNNPNITTFDGCWSFWNGFIPGTFTSAGNGQGFKIGPSATTGNNVRLYQRCLSYRNKKFGFDFNSSTQYVATFYNNTAYLNGDLGFWFGDATSARIYTNNLAYGNGGGITQANAMGTNAVQNRNSWNPATAVTVSDADFQSITSTGINGARSSTGALPVLTFMHLANGSDLIDAGVNVGLPFNGVRPDLGAFESGGGTPPPVLTATSSATTISCFGGSSTVSVFANGGVPPYTGTGTFTRNAGTYTFTVTDQAGTTATTTITVTQPSQITISQSSTTITVNGGTATTTVTASGGTGVFQYSRDGGTFQSSNVFTGVLAGNHTITVRDATSCTNTLNYTLTQPTLLVVSSSSTSITCNGGNSTITVSASGGTPPYSGTGTFTRTAGTYTFSVTDGGGATKTTTITVTQPTAITITQSSTAILVNGGTSTTTVTATGGTGTKNYKLDAGSFQASNVFTGVLAGNHTITVRDANLCTNTLNYTLTQPSVLAVNSSAGTIACNGGTAIISISATGGTAPYTGTGNFVRAVGTWSFTVSDAAGASKTVTVTLTQPAAILITQSSTAIVINGGTSTTTVTASGGTGGLTYKLDAGSFQGSNVFAGVLAGTHTITVKDAAACTNTLNYTITQPAALSATSSVTTAIACNAGSGTITVVASGGTPAYSYRNGSGTPQASGVFSSLTAGTYTFTVTDGLGSTTTTVTTISQPTAISVNVSFGAAPATVTVTASGGVGTLNYRLDAGSFQASNVFSAVAAGNHTVTVRDANLCTASKAFTVGASLGITALTNTIQCNGGTAQITIGATGGTPPYTGPGIYFQSVGTTTYTVTDNAGATHDTTIVLTQPTAIAATVSTGTILVNGGNTTVTVTASGGVGTLNYKLDGGSFQSSNSFSGVLAGNHTVIVRDANGCTVTRTFTITQPGVLNISVTPGAISCFGGNSSVVVTASGGTPPYTGTGTIPTPAGTTTFSVLDAFGTQKDTIITITQPTQISISVSTGIILINGGNTTVTATASGGTGSLQYKIDAGSYQGTGSFSGVLAGTHTVTVKDGNNCTNTNTFSITQPGELIISISLGTAIACNGGTINVTVGATGGTSPYTGTGVFSKTAATYTFTVTDAFGAIADTIITITQPSALTASVSTGTIVVNGGTTTATVTASGGTGGLTYQLDGGSFQGSNSFSGVAAGNHIIVTKDANACTTSTSFNITQPGVLQISVSPTAITCNAGNSTVTISGSGGTAPLTITGGSPQTKTAGTYTFRVTDALGAIHDTIVTITQPTAVIVDSIIIGTIATYGGTTSLVIHATGGTGAFQFKIDGGSYQSDSAFSGIAAGNHTATVKDANNCTGIYNFTVTQPPPPSAGYYLKRRRARHIYIQL